MCKSTSLGCIVIRVARQLPRSLLGSKCYAVFTLILTFDTHTLSSHKRQSKLAQLPFRRAGEWCRVSCSNSSACEATERRCAQPFPSTVVHPLKISEWRKECCKEWRAWMSIWASPCPSISPSAGHLPAALTLRVSVWTQHYVLIVINAKSPKW